MVAAGGNLKGPTNSAPCARVFIRGSRNRGSGSGGRGREGHGKCGRGQDPDASNADPAASRGSGASAHCGLSISRAWEHSKKVWVFRISNPAARLGPTVYEPERESAPPNLVLTDEALAFRLWRMRIHCFPCCFQDCVPEDGTVNLAACHNDIPSAVWAWCHVEVCHVAIGYYQCGYRCGRWRGY